MKHSGLNLTDNKGISLERDPVGGSGIALDSYIWIVTIGLLPIYRYLTAIGFGYISLLVLIFLVGSVAMGRRSRDPGTDFWIVIAVLILSASIFSGFATNFRDTLSVGIVFALMLALAPSVLRFHMHFAGFQKKSLAAFLIVQTISSIAGLSQLFGLTISTREFKGRISGLGDHPNVLGLMCSLAVLLCLYLLLDKGVRLQRWGVILVLLINLVALIFTGSLSSLMALSGGLLVLFAATPAVLGFVIPALVVLLTGFALAGLLGFSLLRLASPILHRINVVTGKSDGVASLDVRQATYDFAWSSIVRRPLIGVGMDSANEGTYNGSTVVHNYILRAFYQGGIILGVTIIIISCYLIFLVLRAMADRRDAGPAAVILAVLVFAMTSAFYDQQQYWLLLIFSASAIEFSQRTVKSAQRNSDLVHKAR